MFSTKEVLNVNIISIVISILVVIILKVWLRVLIKVSEEIYDKKTKYKVTKDYLIKAVIVTSISLFIILTILVHYDIIRIKKNKNKKI